jgi:Protein of unknown function (DUF2975)
MNTTQSNSKDEVRMRRIKKVSKYLRAVMLALLIVEGVGAASAILALLMTILNPSALRSHTIFLNCGTSIFLALSLMITLNFFRLFTRLKDGHLFEGKTINYLELAGKWWIVFGIAQIIYHVVDAHTFSRNGDIPGGDGIFGGLVVFFIAWVLREGQKLKEEQELTV